MSLKTKYGVRFHMPDGSDVTNPGWVHVLEPEVAGAVAVPDGVGSPGAVACGEVGCPVPAAPRAGAEPGMIAVCGAAATSGSPAAARPAGPSWPPAPPPEVRAAAPGRAMPPCPVPGRLTIVSEPASVAH